MFKCAPRRLTAREAPGCCVAGALRAGRREPGEVPLPVITAPDGRSFRWDDPELPGARDDLGREVTLDATSR